MFTNVNMLHNNFLLRTIKKFACLCYFKCIFGQLLLKAIERVLLC